MDYAKVRCKITNYRQGCFHFFVAYFYTIGYLPGIKCGCRMVVDEQVAAFGTADRERRPAPSAPK
ncbi:MAG: hypothetical protein ACI353_05785 [Alloprevotella sp.]